MTMKNHTISDLIGSRICHDLISPLGAISNGVELLTMSGETLGPEISLIAESVNNANAKIKFFRIAFGSAGKEQLVAQSEIISIIRDNSNSGRLVIDWQPRGSIPRQQVKLAFLLLQCFETAMPWGGRVTVSCVGDQWAVYGEADRMSLDHDVWQVLSKPNDALNLDPAKVHFALAPIAAQEIDRRLTVESSINSARVRF